jgi:hypothetical protein
MKLWFFSVILALGFRGPLLAEGLLVGWSSASITPDRPVALSGQFHTRISQAVHDPITATALALDNGSQQAVMVSLDLISVSPPLVEAVRAKLKKTLPDFQADKLVLNATHTHTAPDVDNAYPVPEGVMTSAEYVDFLTELVAGAVVRAWQTRRPAGVSWGLGHAVIGYNRRAIFADGTSIMYAPLTRPDFLGFEGSEDHGVELLFFWTPEQKLTGIGINIACPAQALGRESFISADFWHDARVELRKRYGDELFVFPMIGAAGDQSPHVQLRKAAESKMRKRLGISVTSQIARRIVQAVDDVYPAAAASIRNEVPFAHRVEELRLPVRRVTQAEMEAAELEYARLEKTPDDDEKRYVTMQWILSIMERYRRQDSEAEFPMELHVIRLGDVALATNPFELFLDFGLRMKARSRAELTLIVELANGAGDYLPTAKGVAGGGYGAEISSNLVGPEGGQILVDRTVTLIHSLFE